MNSNKRRRIILGVVIAAIIGIPLAVLLSWQHRDRCPGAMAAAEGVENAIRGLPGVVDTWVRIDMNTCPEQVESMYFLVFFAPNAGKDPIIAAASITDDLRTSDFAGTEVTVRFGFGEHNDLGYLWANDLFPAEDLLAETATWLDLHARYPGAQVTLGRSIQDEPIRSVEVPVVWNEDPASISAAFRDLRVLDTPNNWETNWAVRAIGAPDQSGQPTESIFKVWDAVPSDEKIRLMVAVVARPESMAPTGTVATEVSLLTRVSHLNVSVIFDNAATPAHPAQQIAADFAAQVKAAGHTYDMKISGSSGETFVKESSY